MTTEHQIWYADRVKWLLRFAALSALFVLNSCAYMQTHKNVEELGSYYEGYVLNCQDLRVYHNPTIKKWYINAHPAHLKLHYPSIHDSVFRRSDNLSSFREIQVMPDFVYFPISESTAQVLLRKDGYIQIEVLADEIQKSFGSVVEKNSTLKSHSILAQIDGNKSFQISSGIRVPSQKNLINQVLSKVDLILVDVPGTLAYNVAIPFVAPFVFFNSFLREN